MDTIKWHTITLHRNGMDHAARATQSCSHQARVSTCYSIQYTPIQKIV
jgi:hypothetical protein